MTDQKISTFPLSVNGYSWKVKQYDLPTSKVLSQRFNLPEAVANILAMRGVTLEDAQEFLEPSLKNSLPDPSHLLDMDKAVERIVTAITSDQKIAIFGDYDVDGATSSALLNRYFTMLGHSAIVYIPDRINEGYGPNSEALLGLREQGADVCITVDCGTVSFDPIADAQAAGLDMIVMDHHLSVETLPKACAVVNPNRIDESSPHRNLAAVGVCFLFVVGINRALRAAGYFTHRKEPNIMSLLDLVALGTVCDVMTLTGLNRVFVTQGLKVMGNRQNMGIRTLCDTANLDSRPSAYHLGFVLGPRINACGRIGVADYGTRLLSTNNPDEAYTLALELDRLNQERKAIEQTILEEALAQAETLPEDAAIIMVAKEGWHPGVIGIVASRLKEKYGKPSAVIALDNGIGKASARSVSGVNLGSAVTSARMEGLLVAGGGHAMAAGFTVEADKLPAFTDYMNQRLRAGVEAYGQHKIFEAEVILHVSGISVRLAKMLEQLGPFGNGNPQPRFIIENALVELVKLAGQEHLMVMVKDGSVGGNPKSRCKAMAFRCVGTPMGDLLQASHGKRLHLAGKINVNIWQQIERAEFIIDDVCVAE